MPGGSGAQFKIDLDLPGFNEPKFEVEIPFDPTGVERKDIVDDVKDLFNKNPKDIPFPDPAKEAEKWEEIKKKIREDFEIRYKGPMEKPKKEDTQTECSSLGCFKVDICE